MWWPQTDHVHTQVAWAFTSDSGAPLTRVRSRYREDPMTVMPKWVVTMVIDKMLPRGLAAMRKGAVEYEKRVAQREEAAASAGPAAGPALAAAPAP